VTSTHWLLALAVVVALAVATWAHLAFWSWRLAAPGGEDERLEATTDDGWILCLGRRRPVGPPRHPPVLLLHGIAMNRLALDFGVAGYSMAAALSAGGLDCFSLDLRGHGGSRPGPGAPADWTLDDYLERDLPAALDALRAATGQPRAFLVGHSQGALLALAAAGRFPERVAGVVAMAPPVRLLPGRPGLRTLPLLARLGVTRRVVRLIAPFGGLWQPPALGATIQLGQMEPAIYRRMMMNAIEDLPVGVVGQFAAFLREDRFGSLDGRQDHREALARCVQPALFVAAPLDGMAPSEVVREAHDRWGGEKAWLLLPDGVGHTDMLLGRQAPAALYPAVRDWLVAHAESVGAA